MSGLPDLKPIGTCVSLARAPSYLKCIELLGMNKAEFLELALREYIKPDYLPPSDRRKGTRPRLAQMRSIGTSVPREHYRVYLARAEAAGVSLSLFATTALDAFVDDYLAILDTAVIPATH